MTAFPKDTAAIVTYGDHEVIVPVNKLRKAILKGPRDAADEDPVLRAEKALASLSSEFNAWMDAECDRLEQARRDVAAAGLDERRKEALFRAAHDIKGEAATFGFPAVADAADSLCRLIEHTPDPDRIPLTLVDQHVDAVRAIHREYARCDAAELAFTLTRRLREVTDEFLVHENRDRPEVIEVLMAPSVVPD